MSTFPDRLIGNTSKTGDTQPNALALSGLSAILVDMTNELTEIADIVRGVATEKRCNQQRVADILNLSRGSVSERFTGKVPFGAHEILALSREWGTPVSRFYPAEVRVLVGAA